jgi:site-specific recombinase
MKSIIDSIPNALNNIQPIQQLIKSVRPSRLQKISFAESQIDHLIWVLKSDDKTRRKFNDYLSELIRSNECLDAFCESGILPGTSFFSELYRRAVHKIIPEIYPENDLRAAIAKSFSQKIDLKWMLSVPLEKWSQLFDLIEIDKEQQKFLTEQITNAIVILSHRVTSLGLEPEIATKLPEIDKLSSPFITQSEEIILFIKRLSKSQFYTLEFEIDYKQILVLLNQCEELLKGLRDHKNDYGASISLTYILVRLQQHIRRLRLLLKILMKDDRLKYSSIVFLLHEIVKAEHDKNSFLGYIHQNIDLIAYQVAEHGSKTGQHYITQTKGEYFQLFTSSMKGGFIVGFMAMFKILISYVKMAPAWYAMSYSLNYALGFITMHMSHSALATKQPALTAQAMASTIHHDLYEEKKLDGIGEMVARVSRSQLVSFAGNLLIVFPTGMLVAFLYQLIWGGELTNPMKANHLIHELHPFLSGSLIFGSIAGVYLFLTGIISGYIDNLVIYQNIPHRVAKHVLLRRVFSEKVLFKISRYIEHNIGAIIGNLFFGICMGSTSVIGHFFGINADIRHITFAAANFGIALISLNFEISLYDILWTIAGIIGIGFFNFMVSFNLAFYVALKARGVVIKDTVKIIGSIWSYFKSHPTSFLFPSKRQV